MEQQHPKHIQKYSCFLASQPGGGTARSSHIYQYPFRSSEKKSAGKIHSTIADRPHDAARPVGSGDIYYFILLVVFLLFLIPLVFTKSHVERFTTRAQHDDMCTAIHLFPGRLLTALLGCSLAIPGSMRIKTMRPMCSLACVHSMIYGMYIV